MGEDSKIEWTHHTFNPWEGCEKISPGCKHCYAAERDNHWHRGKHWGAEAPRYPHTDEYWRKPHKWNAAAAAAGERRRVFCASLADVLEDRRDLDASRARLWPLIAETPWLDWLLVTKRPENAEKLLPPEWFAGAWPRNVWFGFTAEDQEHLEKRARYALDVPAPVIFVSAEPLLGPLDFERARVFPSPPWPQPIGGEPWMNLLTGEGMRPSPLTGVLIESQFRRAISWVIVGGESGRGARQFREEWARDIKRQCDAAGVAFFMKQYGERAVVGDDLVALRMKKKGGDIGEFAGDLRVRAFPEVRE